MRRIIPIFFIFICSIQCGQTPPSRKVFSIEIVINPVIQVGSDGSSGSFTTDFLWGYSERKYIINQDTIKVYGFDSSQALIPLYIDTLSDIESGDLYSYLRGKRLDTLGEISIPVDHGMKTTIHISGDSLPTAIIVNDFAFEPSIMDILLHVDKVVKNKKIRMYND